MIDKEKAKMNMKKQWIKFGVVTALYLLFLLWVKSWLGLIVVPPLRFPELRHPVEFPGEELAHGRLPLCFQAQLRSPYP